MISKTFQTFGASLALALFAFGAEMSVFDAGKIDSASPYGLSENEKTMLKSKQKVEHLAAGYTSVESRLEGVETQVEGVRSIVEGLSNSKLDSDNRISRIEQTQAELMDKLDEILEQIEALKPKAAKKKETSKPRGSEPAKEQAKEQAKLEPAALFARALTDYESKKLDDANKGFKATLEAKHRPAACNYYIAQIAFSQKKYDDALYHYKNAVSLYQSAGQVPAFMPAIYKNTALSLQKLGRSGEAAPFINKLKLDFPDSAEARSIN